VGLLPHPPGEIDRSITSVGWVGWEAKHGIKNP
jgi:hypothetical protein